MALYLKTRCVECGAEAEACLWFTTAITQEGRRCRCGRVKDPLRIEIRPDPVGKAYEDAAKKDAANVR